MATRVKSTVIKAVMSFGGQPLKLTEQPSTHSLQHGEYGEEVQRSIDALEAIRLAQAAGDLLHQQRA